MGLSFIIFWLFYFCFTFHLTCVATPLELLTCKNVRSPGGGGTPYNGLNGEALSKRGAFFKLTVYRVGKIFVNLIY